MFFYLTARLVSSLSAFLYPGYASYKTLSQRPASEAELERWLMYWSVLGCIIGVEYVAEWAISWIPFYHSLKTLFLLYLALPQTQGASYLYTQHLQPFFHSHETQIDATLASFKARAYAFVQERLRLLWEQVTAAALGQQLQPQGGNVPAGATPPPQASGPGQLLGTFWRSYGPAITTSVNALLRQPSGAPPPTLDTPRSSYITASGSQTQTMSVEERRRQLQAELASLSTTVPETVMPTATPQVSTSRTSSSTSLVRERTSSAGGKFEEIDVPSDTEGYDLGDGPSNRSHRPKQRNDQESDGYESGKSAGKAKAGWFGGWGVTTSDGEKDKPKSD